MPIEIKELHIRALVQESSADNKTTASPSASPAQINVLISLCVEQVLKILKEKQER